MKITYDAEADAMYIYLQGKPGEAVDHGKLGFPRGCPEVSLEQMIFKGSCAR